MAGKIVAFDRVDLSGKSLAWLTVAMIAVILCWGVANWGATKVKGLTKQAGPVDEFA